MAQAGNSVCFQCYCRIGVHPQRRYRLRTHKIRQFCRAVTYGRWGNDYKILGASALAGSLQGNTQFQPFTTRLKAWWHGDVLPDKPKRKLSVTKTAPEETTKSGRQGPPDPWSEAAADVAQAVWGSGFCGPCGAGYLKPLSHQLELSPKMSLLQLGAELGGPAKVLAAYNKVNITAYEASRTLVNIGSAQLKQADTPGTHLRQYDPEHIPSFAQIFDRACSEGALFNVARKERLLEKIVDKLRPSGRLVLTEYVLGGDAVMGRESFKDWSAQERLHPHLVLAEDLCDMLSDLHMQVHLTEDISRQHFDMIKNAWTDVEQKALAIAEEGGGVEKVQLLMKEAAFWMRRKKMLRSREIKRWRIVAKKKAGIRTLSDW